MPVSLHGKKDPASVRIMGGWKVYVLLSDPDPDKIDRQECHAEHPAESGEQGDRCEPHLSDHDGGTDRTENNVQGCSAEGGDHVALSFKIPHVSASCKTEYIENRDQPYITVSVTESQIV